MKTKIAFTIAAIMAFNTIKAQDIDSVLYSIEQNNTELKALQKNIESRRLDIKAQNNLEDPSVEYSPFYNKETSGIASSELVVSQSFDFPTLYAARNKAGRLQQNVLNQEYLTARRNILLNAKILCLDIIYQERKKSIIDIREKNAEHMIQLVEKRLEEGDANILEVNKVKMDKIGIITEKTQVEDEIHITQQTLVCLNGNKPLSLVGMDYPTPIDTNDMTIYENAITNDLDIIEVQANVAASEQEIKINKQNWLPKIDIGYRRNTDGTDASNGFLVGATFPLFSSRNKIKAAKAKNESELLKLANAKATAENDLKAKIRKMKRLKQITDAYDIKLMNNTLELLKKAVENGEISISDYYTEADVIYRNMLSRVETERQYQGIIADICKNEL